jgi:adenylate kinase family enzyme
MKSQNQDIPLLTKLQFSSALHYEIERVGKGLKHDWNDNGLHKRLLMDEAQKLVRSKAYKFEALKLDPEKAEAYLADYPEALEKMTFSNPVPLKQAIVDAVEQVILDRVFDQEHRAIVVHQWLDTRADDVLEFVRGATDKYRTLTGREINYRDQITKPEDLEAIAATVFEIREAFHNEDEDDDYLNEVRRADEFLEFLEFVKAGDISLDNVLGERVAMGLGR